MELKDPGPSVLQCWPGTGNLVARGQFQTGHCFHAFYSNNKKIQEVSYLTIYLHFLKIYIIREFFHLKFKKNRSKTTLPSKVHEKLSLIVRLNFKIINEY